MQYSYQKTIHLGETVRPALNMISVELQDCVVPYIIKNPFCDVKLIIYTTIPRMRV